VPAVRQKLHLSSCADFRDRLYLTPGLALAAQARGFHAFHAPWVGLSGASDAKVAAHAITRNLILVTNNLLDFRRIYRRRALHPGLIFLTVADTDIMDREAQHHMFGAAIESVGESEPVNEAITVHLSENAEGDWIIKVVRAALPHS
jgi:predicted nuclease of predicted toxin-antitoxin system